MVGKGGGQGWWARVVGKGGNQGGEAYRRGVDETMLEQSRLEVVLAKARGVACDCEDGLTRREDAHLRTRWEKVGEGRRR